LDPQAIPAAPAIPASPVFPVLAARGDAHRTLKTIASFLVVIFLTYLGLLAVTFFIGRVMPIDPVLAIVGDRAPESVIIRVREELGLNKPLWEQFYIYLSKVAKGDFGTSVLTSNSVLQDIRRTFPATIELATLGILIGAGIGVPLGVWAAVRRGGIVDQIVRVMGLVGYSVPIFWLGLMGLVLFYAKLGWVGGPGRMDVTYEYTLTSVSGFLLLDAAMAGQWDAFGNVLSHLILPASLLGYFSLAYISRMTRSFMLNELAQEYVVAARAKGLTETRIIWGHALRNAMVPLVTVIALSYAGLLEGSVLTETVFAWPGLGLYITNSLQNADMNAVLGGTLVVGSVFIGLNLLSDLLYKLLDPRTRVR
jgi:peptide/nickel transport system permease protein